MAIETLIGRTATITADCNTRNYNEATIANVSPWMKEGMSRDYIGLSGSGARLIAKLFQPVQGKVRCDFAIDTPHGRICGIYSSYASSGSKQWAARELVAELFA